MAELALRDYQTKIVDDIVDQWGEGRRRLIVWLPTGGGKTEIAAALAKREAEAGGCTLFVVERRTLAGQARDRYTRYGLLTGLLRGDDTFVRGYEPAVVASIQTLASRAKHPDVLRTLARVTLIVVDEAHIQFKHHDKILAAVPDARVIGLTATPLREGLGLRYEARVDGPSYEQMIGAGYLVRLRYFLPHAAEVREALRKVHVTGGEYKLDELSALMRRKTLIGDIVTTWRRLAQDRPTIVFCVDIAHSKAVCDAFLAAGVAAAHIDEHTSEDDRRRMFADFAAGRIRVLCSVVVLSIGFDQPTAAVAVLARPTLSLSLHVQQIGRVMRPAAGKADCLVLDHACNVLRHGKVEDFDPPPLSTIDKHSDRKKKTGDQTDYSPCPACRALMSPGQRICAECGHEIARKSRVDYLDGELTEDGSTRSRQPSRADIQHFYQECAWIGASQGYKPGFAYAKTLERYGIKAPFAWRDLPLLPASQETSNWLRSRRIAYLKAKQRSAA